jgi:hypothetical protein
MKIIFILIFIFSISATVYAATSSSLLLQAQVPRIVSIAVTSLPIATALDLTVSQTNLKVGVVNERSNSKTGYKASVSSANLGKLKRVSGADVFAYSLIISGQTIDLSTAAGSTYSFLNTQLTDTNRDIFVSYSGKPAELMVEGNYQDTITFQISAI